MPNFTISPNMQLPVPIVGTQSGPQYAINIDSSLAIIDSHDHSLGSGVQVTPSGLNINGDLSIQSNNLTNVLSLVLAPQLAVLPSSLLNRVYDVNGNLFFNDGLGNQIAITANGAVAGTPGSIANLVSPASAAYIAVSSTFVFQSDVNTPANLDGASLNLRNLVANSLALTLSPPTLSSNYTLTLPFIPTSTKLLTINNAGVISSAIYIDNSTLNIASNNIQIADQGVIQQKLATKPINGGGPGAFASSGSSGSFSTTSTSFVDVPSVNSLISASTSLRPVCIAIVPDGTTVPSVMGNGNGMVLQVIDSTNTFIYGVWEFNVNSNYPNLLTFDLSPSTSGRIYKLQIKTATTGTSSIVNVKMVAYEI